MTTQTNTKWTAVETRKTFLDFFVSKKNHTFVPSSLVVPYNDPTLLFTNAGMNQFKPNFLGQVDPKSVQATWKRTVNSQKCIRAGGKHNDLEAVGNDTYHHTFFEMLGNWSFGDYFKKEAIPWAWELLTEVYGLDKNRIYVTYFGGSEAEGVEPDREAAEIWGQFLPKERILPFDKKDNFWEMGETGPCGPCTEIHYDRIGGRDAASLVNMDDPTVIEIWNVVFIQFNREKDSSLSPLPAKHVDTGMGFERLLSILQNEPSNYDTDLFAPIFEKIKEVTKAPHEYTKKLADEDPEFVDKAYRVIADHIRTLTFAINDGAAPGPNGRNHVVRTILRRAVRYGVEILKADPEVGFFHKLVPVVIESLGDAFPELKKNPQNIINVIKMEEDAFNKTLKKGTAKFTKMIVKLKEGDQIPTQDAFILYNRYGFPLELTKTIGWEKKKLVVDEEGFKQLATLEAIKAAEASNFGGSNKSLILNAAELSELTNSGIPKTDDSFKFLYGSQGNIEATIVAVAVERKEGEKVVIEFIKEETNSDQRVGILLDRTTFYAEGGGQISDNGKINNANSEFIVEDVQVYGGYVLHIGQANGVAKVGETVSLEVDYERRSPIMNNHSATHMLNFALRSVLGEGIDQRGSIVQSDKLRFDFSFGKQLTKEELIGVDKNVNDLINSNVKVFTKEISLDVAKKINGIRAVFGEIYPDPVRVVVVGADVDEIILDPSNSKWNNYSVELCGGTHVSSTSQLLQFVVITEEAVSSGIRRIVACTGNHAVQAIKLGNELSSSLDTLMKSKDISTDKVSAWKEVLNVSVIPASKRSEFKSLLDGPVKDLLREASRGQAGKEQELIAQLSESIISKLKSDSDNGAKDLSFVGKVSGVAAQGLTNSIKEVHKRFPSAAVLLLAETEGKKKGLVWVVAVPKDWVSKGLKAGEWAKVLATASGGRGGGKEITAQGSSTDTSKLDELVSLAEEYVKNISK